MRKSGFDGLTHFLFFEKEGHHHEFRKSVFRNGTHGQADAAVCHPVHHLAAGGRTVYTDMKWGYAQNDHLTLDSGVLGIDKCAKLIAELF